MADLHIDLTTTSRTTATGRARRLSMRPDEEALRDARNSALIPPDHVIRRGFPYVPKILVESTAVLSADGSYIPDDTYPWEAIFTDAHTRFIAQENLFDDIADKWNPFYSEGVDYYFTWSGLSEPRLEEHEYRIGKLLYQMNSIRLEEDTSLVSSFNANMDDASSFMIAVAGVINSSERASLMRVGDTMGTSISIEVDEYFYIRNQYGTAKLKTVKHPSTMTPFYMVLVNDPTTTELLVADGTARIARASIPNQDSSRSLEVYIGEDLAGAKTLDMNLFEFTVFPYAYGGPMSAAQVISAMADVYGSNS